MGTDIVTPAHRPRQAAADGLRGLAALNVVIAHFVAAFWPSALHGNYPESFSTATHPSPWDWLLQLPLVNIGFNGAFAVAVFFALSGHVLAQHDATAPGSHVFWRRALARWPRLGLPVMAGVLCTYALFAAGAMQHQALGFLPTYADSLSWAKVGAEAAFGVLWLGWSQTNPPLWSLRWEFVGSLALLLVLALWGRWPRVWRGMVLLLGAGAIAWLGGGSTYLLALLGGALWTLRRGTVQRFLCWRVLQWLGRVSFAIYLVHFAVLMSVAMALSLVLRPWGFGGVWLVLLVYLGVCLLAAVWFERWIDRPAVSASRRMANAFLGLWPLSWGQTPSTSGSSHG